MSEHPEAVGEPGRRPSHRLLSAPRAMLKPLPIALGGSLFQYLLNPGDKTSCWEPHSIHMWRRLSAEPHDRVPTVRLAAMAGGVALLHVSKEVCWCSMCDF